MRITVKLFATLRKYAGEDKKGVVELDFDDPVSVGQVLQQLTVPEEIPKIILINSVQKQPDDMLADGDELSVFPPIAGG